MAKYIAFSRIKDAEIICAHMHNMGFKGEILRSCKQVRTFVAPEATGNFERLLDALTKIL